MIDPAFLAVLACPRCAERPPLTEQNGRLVCTKCRFSYAVIDGIPHLVAEEAEPPAETPAQNQS